MTYAKVKDGQVILIGLPETGFLNDGSSVSGYDLLPDNVISGEGWLPIEYDQPVYDPATQTLQFVEYIVQADKVISRSIAVDIAQ